MCVGLESESRAHTTVSELCLVQLAKCSRRNGVLDWPAFWASDSAGRACTCRICATHSLSIMYIIHIYGLTIKTHSTCKYVINRSGQAILPKQVVNFDCGIQTHDTTTIHCTCTHCKALVPVLSAVSMRESETFFPAFQCFIPITAKAWNQGYTAYVWCILCSPPLILRQCLNIHK